jgi:integrase/recombinase XerD
MNNKENLQKYREYLDARNRSINYGNTMKLWLEYMEEKKIDIITQEVITEFFNTTNYSASSRNQFIKAGRDYYSNFLQIPKEQNEWYKLKLLAVAYKIPDFLTPKDIEEAKKILRTYYIHKCSTPKIEALIDFLFATGCRKAELLNLKRADIDLENNKAKVFGKGKKERYVYFNLKTKREIEAYYKTEPEYTNAFNISLGKLSYIVKLLTEHLGKKVYLHLIRHSSARNMIMKDVPLLMVSKILGHSSISTTMRYCEPDEKMINDKYKEKME